MTADLAKDPAMRADDVIRLLDLTPHPEGGHFRETFRDAVSIATAGDAARAASTAIYFLLKAGEVSRWHTVDAAETWHYYAGAPLLLETATPDGNQKQALHLGCDLAQGERPQAVVLPHHWQRAQSLGDWTLVGCTVAPGFTFNGFVIAAEGFKPGD